MFSKLYELPISPNYVGHWGVVEACRELFQNAIDSESPFQYEIGDDFIKITSKYSKLEPSTLLLGTTSKADDNTKIGSFGEGYKIALLVLTRNNRSVDIFNNDVIWKPLFKHSKQFCAEVLCIEESRYAQGRGQGLTFKVNDLSTSEIEQIKESNIHMWDTIGQVHETRYGQILLDHPGKLFVNGLFVCDTELKFGYNIKPEYLTLERDRQTVSSFDLKFITKQMWFETGQYNKIAEMIADETKDLEYANYGTPALVKEACYEVFKERHPNAIAVNSQSELKKLVEQGLERVVYVANSTFYDCVSSSKSYSTHDVIKMKSPNDLMHEWFSKNRGLMRKDAIVSFKALIEKSINWKLK